MFEATVIVGELQSLPPEYVSKSLIGKAFRQFDAHAHGGKVPRDKLVTFVMKNQPKRLWRLAKKLRIDKVPPLLFRRGDLVSPHD